MKLIPIIQKVNRITKEISESQTIISVILPILKYLGWDIFNENRVIFEDVTTTRKRVDITLIFQNNSKFLIEAKRLSHKLSMKDFEQLTLYLNSDNSVNFGILTNGIDYWIADNKIEGLENKKIYSFNIFDITECDLNILKLFFSFNPSYNLKDLNRYINYIQMGIDFGDKKCEKVLNISNFEIDLELEPKTSKELIDTSSLKKPNFNKHKSSFETFLENQKKESKNSNQDEVRQETSSPNIINEESKNTFESELFQNYENETQTEDRIENVSKTIHDEFQDVEVIQPKSEDEQIEFFELLEKNRAKIYLDGKYHIITDESFSSLFVKMLKYTLAVMKSYPLLLNKLIDEFDFIVKENEIDNSSTKHKYETIGDGLYYNINITNYTKLNNIEPLLKFIHFNFE